MVDSRDSSSAFMNKEQFQDFITTISGSFQWGWHGLGADENQFYCGHIIIETPAQRRHSSKDIIVKVNDEDLVGKV